MGQPGLWVGGEFMTLLDTGLSRWQRVLWGGRGWGSPGSEGSVDPVSCTLSALLCLQLEWREALLEVADRGLHACLWFGRCGGSPHRNRFTSQVPSSW